MPLDRRRFTLLFASALSARAQSLAHPGWRGNGIAPEAWWKHAAFLRMAPESTFADCLQAFDTLRSAGADSMILPDLNAAPAAAGGAAMPFDRRFGTEDDLDTLLREASARHVRLLVHIPLARLAGNEGELRFWMNRGLAGVDTTGSATASSPETLRSVRSALARFPGERVVLARDADAGATGSGATLLRLADAAAVELAQGAKPDAVELAADDGTGTPLLALLPLLLTDARPVLDSRLLRAQADRDAVADVFRVRNTQPIYRPGRGLRVTAVPGPADGLRAWLLRDASGSAAGALLLLANRSATAQPVAPAVQEAGLRARYLVPMLRSDGRAGPLTVASDTLPPGAVVLGSPFGSAVAHGSRDGRAKR